MSDPQIPPGQLNTGPPPSLNDVLTPTSVATQPSNQTLQPPQTGLPDPTGHAGQFLTNDGVNPLWATVAGGSGLVYSSIAQMQAAAVPAPNASVTLLGFYSAGDGGQGPFYYSSTSTETPVPGMIVQPTVGGGRYIRLYWQRRFDARWLGAKCDGVTDDTAAIQAAIDFTQNTTFFPVKGGKVYIHDTALVSSQLDCMDTSGLSLVGDGNVVFTSRLAADRPASCLLFTTTGSGLPQNNWGDPALIDARSADGFQIFGLGVLQDNASFTGNFIDLSHSPTGGDAANANISFCVCSGITFDGVHYQVTAKSAVFLASAIEINLEFCSFYRALSGIRGQDTLNGATAYSNKVTIQGSQFSGTPSAVSNPGQTWTIADNTVEGLGGSFNALHLVYDDIGAYGTIQEIDKASHANGDLLTFNDGVNPATVFEYRVTAGSVGPGHIEIDLSGLPGGATAAQVAAVTVAAIKTAGLRLTNICYDANAAVPTGLINVMSNDPVEADLYVITATAAGETCTGLVYPDYAHSCLTIRDNWCGDAFGNQLWIDINQGNGVAIQNNLLAGGIGSIRFRSTGVNNPNGDALLIGNSLLPTTGPCIDANFQWVGGDIDWTGFICYTNGTNAASPPINLPKRSSHIWGNTPKSAFPDTINGSPVVVALAPNEVPSVSGGPVSWWDATQIVGLNNGDPVSTWTDALAHHNLGLGNAPMYVTNVVNSLPVVRFDGVNNYLTSGNIAFAAPCTIVMCMVSDSAVINATAVDGTAGVDTMRIWKTGNYQMNLGGSKVGFSPRACAVYAMINSGQGDGSDTVRAADYVIGAELTSFSDAPQGVVVGRDGGGAHYFSGDVCEIAIFDRVLDPAEIIGVMNYMRAKWNAS